MGLGVGVGLGLGLGLDCTELTLKVAPPSSATSVPTSGTCPPACEKKGGTKKAGAFV